MFVRARIHTHTHTLKISGLNPKMEREPAQAHCLAMPQPLLTLVHTCALITANDLVFIDI